MTSPSDMIDDGLTRATVPNFFGSTNRQDDSAANRSSEEWVPFFGNPWIEPGTLILTDKGQPSMSPEAGFVERSRAAIRKWMDENPY